MILLQPGSPVRIKEETIAGMAVEIVRTPIAEKDRKAVTDMVEHLAADMTAMRRLNVGEAEPALVYAPTEERP
jgi:hypothetical protein